MESSHAQALAKRLHQDAREHDGTPLLRHVERVAAAVTGDACVVAWLHEVLEWTTMTEQELIREGVTGDEVVAVELLTRTTGAGDDAYLGYIERIASAPGRSGRLAREVKLADLEDRLQNPSARDDDWAPPYARGLTLLHAATKEGT